MQVRILSLLGDITNRRIPIVAYNNSPSSSEIAVGIFRQMEQQQPPSFSFGNSSHSYGDGKLQNANIWMRRKTGPANDISISASDGVMAEITSVKSDESDCDQYLIKLSPKSGLAFLRVPVSFSISYTDHDDKVQQRKYEVTLHPDENNGPSGGLQITEQPPNIGH